MGSKKSVLSLRRSQKVKMRAGFSLLFLVLAFGSHLAATATFLQPSYIVRQIRLSSNKRLGGSSLFLMIDKK
jgi:hypothetical protein